MNAVKTLKTTSVTLLKAAVLAAIMSAMVAAVPTNLTHINAQLSTLVAAQSGEQV